MVLEIELSEMNIMINYHDADSSCRLKFCLNFYVFIHELGHILR